MNSFAYDDIRDVESEMGMEQEEISVHIRKIGSFHENI